MERRSGYPCDEALDDLEVFFKNNISDTQALADLLDHLIECRKAGRLGFRYIHEELMKYRKNHSDCFPFSEAEKQMINDLMHFWG
ncbi:hypothetical protein [Agaribacterium haliotis]|uniref:hypothetical protein n=1 Tax=Agaribacterium haliotis TaxID=2013869 RepID=UPI000BB59C29|nr:hypothetical protein [Agaribacterium haliotis]